MVHIRKDIIQVLSSYVACTARLDSIKDSSAIADLLFIDEIHHILRRDIIVKYTLSKKLFISLATGFFIFAFIFTAGCSAKKVKLVFEKNSSSGYSEAGHKHKKKGPPAHAPAHGYRAKHSYRYYPGCSVYFDSGRELYFYIKGDRWEVGVSLPNHLRVRLGDSVSIELDTAKPYIHHAEHVKKYPPGQLKKKHKKKHKWG